MKLWNTVIVSGMILLAGSFPHHTIAQEESYVIQPYFGEQIESRYVLPDTFDFLTAKVPRLSGVTVNDTKIIGVHYPVHHTGNAVLFVAFQKEGDKYHYLTKSKVVENIPGTCCREIVMKKETANTPQTVRYQVTLSNTASRFRYTLEWNQDQQTFTLTRVDE